MNKYNVWKAKSNGDPIEGTDKIYEGTSKRSVMAHIAYENKVKIHVGATLVRLPNGECFVCTKIN